MKRVRIFLFLALLILMNSAQAASVRLKDLVEFEGVRSNDLIGYGLVVGLNGTGDGLRNSPFTEEIMENILERLGVNITGEQARPRNVAAVIVTAKLPAFARTGSRIDVYVSAIGDARSLLGGTLILTPLKAADGEIYAVAQGAVLSGGVDIEGEATRVIQGVPTSGSIPSGAHVEREVQFSLDDLRTLTLALKDPDFTTAVRIESEINSVLSAIAASAIDAGSVELRIENLDLPTAHVLARIENLEIEPEMRARIIIDQKSGTIVLGKDVKISRVAVSQGNLTLRVEEQSIVSQPNPFAAGETITLPRTNATITNESSVALAEVPDAVHLSDVVEGLNALGVTPRDMVNILKTIKASGALHADLIIQ